MEEYIVAFRMHLNSYFGYNAKLRKIDDVLLYSPQTCQGIVLLFINPNKF